MLTVSVILPGLPNRWDCISYIYPLITYMMAIPVVHTPKPIRYPHCRIMAPQSGKARHHCSDCRPMRSSYAPHGCIPGKAAGIFPERYYAVPYRMASCMLSPTRSAHLPMQKTLQRSSRSYWLRRNGYRASTITLMKGSRHGTISQRPYFV